MEATGVGISNLKYVLLFIILVLAQVLLCNNMVLFGVAFPFVFIYFIMVLPMNIGLNLLFTLAFLLGFSVDVFSDTPGLNSLGCVILAALRKPVFYAYMPKEDKFRDIEPSLSTLGWSGFMKYSLTMTAIFCFLVFIVEYFNFFALFNILLCGASSTLFTFFLLLGVDALFKVKK